MNRRMRIAAASMAGVAALVGAVFAIQAPTSNSAATPTVVQAVPDLAVFRSQAPSVAASRMAHLLRRLPPGLADVQATKSLALDRGARADVVSVDSSACIVVTSADGSGGTGCTPKDVVVDPSKPPIVIDQLSNDQYRVTILAGPGITTLTVTQADGTQSEANVVNNVASTVVSGAPTKVSWDGPGGGSITPRS